MTRLYGHLDSFVTGVVVLGLTLGVVLPLAQLTCRRLA
jgi:hypothetical protein